MFLEKNLLGLDIGSQSIKMVDIAKTRSGYQLKSMGIGLIPAECIVDKDIIDSETVVDTIKNLRENLKVRTRGSATAISGHSVIVKKAELALMSEAELRQNLPIEAEQYIPFDINDVYLDTFILGESIERSDMMDVLFVAAKKELVDEYASAVRNAGLKPMLIDIDVFSLETMYEVNYPDAPESIVALVNIGASMINVNVLKDNMSIFARDISMGGRQLTERIQREFNVSFERAENIKTGADIEGIDLEKINYIFKMAAETYVQEIRRTLDFFLSTMVNENIEKIYISGGSSRIPGITRLLEKQMEIPVEIVNPFNNISWDERVFDPEYMAYIAPQMAVAVGLALRRADYKW
ncbi:MAG TPA: type IV pilus assembly protein PilM [Deltaproteobacteria bacterium]|mgnify:FL=1|nr:type IV pilus assembly protein PilM [Deltaproteobacteria bacterium]HOM28297.1 type IV pilus assembly protein PilM [Deltaproteobacteria bacterium]HPP80664.1 type IV pilus assembly protein PilM [Deltaproteobacteria bacterium]